MLKYYSQEDIENNTKSLIDSITQLGWDDVIFFTQAQTGISVLDVADKILNQTRIISMAEVEEKAQNPIHSYGVGTSFGGLLNVEFPNLVRIMSYQIYDPKNTRLREMSEELNGYLLQDSIEAADRRASEMLRDLSSFMVPLVYRGFIRVLIPVKFRE